VSFFDERYAQEVHQPKPKPEPVPPPKKRSRAWLLLLPVALVVLVMVLGCSDEPPEQNVYDRVFLDFVESLPTYEGVSDDELIDLAHDVCDTLDSGVTPEAYLAQWHAKVENGEISTDEWSDGLILQGAAVGVYCPEYADVSEVPVSEVP
jgi:hypothetical protein